MDLNCCCVFNLKGCLCSPLVAIWQGAEVWKRIETKCNADAFMLRKLLHGFNCWGAQFWVVQVKVLAWNVVHSAQIIIFLRLRWHFYWLQRKKYLKQNNVTKILNIKENIYNQLVGWFNLQLGIVSHRKYIPNPKKKSTMRGNETTTVNNDLKQNWVISYCVMPQEDSCGADA